LDTESQEILERLNRKTEAKEQKPARPDVLLKEKME
jgi:hypothetical protein